MSRAKHDLLFKVLIIGDSGVGKTAIMQRFCENKFDEIYISTVGVDFKPKMIEINGKVVKMQIWDTAGQEKFMNITASYYRNTHGVVIVYDVTDPASLEKVAMWFGEVTEKTTQSPPAIIVVGNKHEGPGPFAVSAEEARGVVSKLGKIEHFECSAKTGDGVNEMFAALLRQIMAKSGDAPKDGDAERVTLEPEKKGACC